MKRPLAAVFNALTPGRTEAREVIDRVRQDVRELSRSLQHIEQRARKEDARRDAQFVEALAAITTQVQDLTREIRSVQDSVGVLTLRESQLRAVFLREAELEDLEPTLASLLTRAGTGEHIIAALESASLQLEPFPYVVVDNLLPDAIYDALITGLPPSELFRDKPVNKQQIKVPFQFAPAYARRVWRYMSEVLAPQLITPAIVEKFHEPLTRWIRENWPGLGDDPLRGTVRLHSTDGRIMLRRRGYRIPPHRDPKWGFLTCLIYLARPDDRETWGTQLYSVASDTAAPGVTPHWIDPGSCTLVEDVAFRRNRALIFLNSAGAHGAAIPVDAEPADLERYLYQFRIGPNRPTMNAMTESLPDERRSAWTGKLVDY
jgi:hypothetical protein